MIMELYAGILWTKICQLGLKMLKENHKLEIYYEVKLEKNSSALSDTGEH